MLLTIRDLSRDFHSPVLATHSVLTARIFLHIRQEGTPNSEREEPDETGQNMDPRTTFMLDTIEERMGTVSGATFEIESSRTTLHSGTHQN